MFESPLAVGLVFFALGFFAGLIVANLREAMRNGSSASQTKSKSPRVDSPRPGPPEERTSRVSPRFAPPADAPKRASASPLGSFLRSLKPAKTREKPQPQTMAAEIDAILQEKLPGTGLAGRTIRILEQPGFGLLVIVDGESYEGVDAVTDEAVRDLIRSAVDEWQRRASGRLD